MIVATGCDHAGFVLKPAVENFFRGKAEILDCGIFSEARADYPDIAFQVAKAVADNAADAGVLICGTGIGMAISANKVRGIRAGVCNDPETARLGKSHNNLNVLCMGGRILSPDKAESVLDAWYGASFEGGRHLARINKIAAAESSVLSVNVNTEKNKVVVFNHPLIQHKMSLVRDKNTSVREFRELVQEIAGLMVYEITRDLSLSEVRLETPLAPATAYTLTGKKLAVVPVLRAGLGMVDGILQLIPNARVGHVGLYRDPITLAPVEYYCKLPDDIGNRDIFVLDPMLATGGSAAEAVSLVKARGGQKISLVCLIATPEGIEKVHSQHPEVGIFAAALDSHLNGHGYIVPGLGDAGDRLFGTK